MPERKDGIESPTARGLDERALKYTASIAYDRRLYRHDIAGSIAHAAALARAGKATGDGCAVTGQHRGADSALALGFGPHR